MLDALIPALTVLKEVRKTLLHPSFLYTNISNAFFFHGQKLDAGDDPLTAFLVSSEAAMKGAESTRDMHAQVIQVSYLFWILLNFMHGK